MKGNQQRLPKRPGNWKKVSPVMKMKALVIPKMNTVREKLLLPQIWRMNIH